jgi:hypothetical protein
MKMFFRIRANSAIIEKSKHFAPVIQPTVVQIRMKVSQRQNPANFDEKISKFNQKKTELQNFDLKIWPILT